MNIHPLHMLARYLAYVPNLLGTFVSGTYLGITGEVEVAVGCVAVIYAKMLGPHNILTTFYFLFI